MEISKFEIRFNFLSVYDRSLQHIIQLFMPAIIS